MDSFLMTRECYECIFHQAHRLFKKCRIDEKGQSFILNDLADYSKKTNDRLTPLDMGQYLNRLVREYTGVTDHYTVEKAYYNRLLLDHYTKLKSQIRGPDASRKAIKFTLAANIIDFGQQNINFDILYSLSNALKLVPFIDHTEQLLREVSKASTILYLGDNAGEIVVDKLFIETLRHPNIYYAVRGGYILNDVTHEDARWVGMQEVAKVIDNGHDAPSTVLSKCSEKFMKIYNRADLVISKGQGNMEGLIGEKEKNIFFLSLVKCQVVADTLNIPVGKPMVWHNQINRNDWTREI